MSASCGGEETREGHSLRGGKGLEMRALHDPVLHMTVLMCVAHEHHWLPSTYTRHVARATRARADPSRSEGVIRKKSARLFYLPHVMVLGVPGWGSPVPYFE
jgi:hypothetical protein